VDLKVRLEAAGAREQQGAARQLQQAALPQHRPAHARARIDHAGRARVQAQRGQAEFLQEDVAVQAAERQEGFVVVGDARELAQLVGAYARRQARHQVALQRIAHAHQDGGQQETGAGLFAALGHHRVVHGARGRRNRLETGIGIGVGEVREKSAHACGRIGQMNRAQRESALQLVGQAGFEAESLVRWHGLVPGGPQPVRPVQRRH